MGKVRFVESSEPILTEPLIYSLPARVACENSIQADTKTRMIRLIVTPEMGHIIEASILRFVENELGKHGAAATDEQKQAIDVRLQLALRELLSVTGEELEEFVNRLAHVADSLTLEEEDD